MSAGGSTKVIIISLIANFCIALAKLAAALFTKSAALLAESVHSFADCGNQILLLYGQKAAKKGVSDLHPMGRAKESFFWSFVVALLLFSMGGMFSLYEGWHKISHPEPMSYPWVGIGVLAERRSARLAWRVRGVSIVLAACALWWPAHALQTEGTLAASSGGKIDIHSP